MKAKVIFSNFFSPEKADAARTLLKQLNIQVDDQNGDDESLPKMKIITKSINEIPYNEKPECLTLTPLCLQYIISAKEVSQQPESESNFLKKIIENPFELQKYGNFFFNLFLLDKILAFGNIVEEEKDRLTQKINFMGGKIGSINDENIYYILTESKCENPRNVPLVLPQWIDCLFESSVEISTNRYKIDENEISSANCSPNTNSSKRSMLLLPNNDNTVTNKSRNIAFKNKNANSQPVNSLKAKSKRVSNKLPAKLDSRQTTLNFGISSKKSEKTSSVMPAFPPPSTQSLVITSSSSSSSSSKQPSQKKNSASQSKSKISRKPSQLKVNDSLKIDNFMTLKKNVKPMPASQLTVTVEGENNNDTDDNTSFDNEYGSNDEAIEPEISQYGKNLQRIVQKRIDQHNLRNHGKYINHSDSSDDEVLIQPIFKMKSKRNNTSKTSSLKKLSILPSILNAMTEDQHLSSDNETDRDDDIINNNNNDYVDQLNNQWENKKKDLVDFSSDFDSKSPNRIVRHQIKNDDSPNANNKIKKYLSKGYESELLNDLTSFSQSTGESQTSMISSVYYDREPKKVADNEDAQKSDMLGKDPLIDCWEML